MYNLIMTDSILEINQLTKKYGLFTAVDNISFKIPKGKIIGLLGPNGAGKTTTIHMLLGITLTNGGKIKYFGKDFFANREYCLSRINFTSSFNTLLGRISVWENLLVFAQLYGVKGPQKKIKDLLEYFEIQSLSNQKYWDLSAGQKTRVNIIKSLINDPDLILMDEPTASLDPDIADKTLSLIEELNKSRGLSILYTSHEMDEVTRICNEVIFLQRGKIVAQDSPLNLTKKISDIELQLTFEDGKTVLQDYLKEREFGYYFLNPRIVRIKTNEKMISTIISELTHKKLSILDVEVNKPTLEHVFLQIARGDPDALD